MVCLKTAFEKFSAAAGRELLTENVREMQLC